MKKGITQAQAQKLAWEATLTTGALATHSAIVNSLLRAAGRK